MKTDKYLYYQKKLIELFMATENNLKDEYVSQFRKLYILNEMFPYNFDLLLHTLECFLPAYRYDRNLDENGDVGGNYYKLHNMLLDNSVTDKELLERLISEEL